MTTNTFRNAIAYAVAAASAAAVFFAPPALSAAESKGPGLLKAAYQQELRFLRAEAEALKARLSAERKKLRGDEQKAQQTQAALRAQVLKMQSAAEEKERAAEKIALSTDDKSALREQLQSQLAAFAPAAEGATLAEHFQNATTASREALIAGRGLKAREGMFFDAHGKEQKGTLTDYGAVATYGERAGRAFLLAPTGTGALSVFETMPEGRAPTMSNIGDAALPAVLYADKGEAIIKKKDVTVRGQLDASGPIGWAIFVLGLFGFLLIMVRTVRVALTARTVRSLEASLGQALNTGDIVSTKSTVQNSRFGVLAFGPLFASKAPSRSADETEGGEDALVDEGLLAARGHFEMLSTAILVVAAVAPLMGLLGTVTGMISTFDSITTFGTGDPRILSGGISEALLTTEFGLVVAIPTLLLGNLLSAWGRGLESRTESLLLRTLRVLRSTADSDARDADASVESDRVGAARADEYVLASAVRLPPATPTTDLPAPAVQAG